MAPSIFREKLLGSILSLDAYAMLISYYCGPHSCQILQHLLFILIHFLPQGICNAILNQEHWHNKIYNLMQQSFTCRIDEGKQERERGTDRDISIQKAITRIVMAYQSVQFFFFFFVLLSAVFLHDFCLFPHAKNSHAEHTLKVCR